MKLSKISVSNPIGTSMAFIAILIIGIISLNSLPRDVMPNIDFPTLTVITIYPGASPEDVEKDVTKTLELILATTPNLKNMTSKSRENVSILTLQFEWESDITDAANNVRDLMEVVKNDLPSAAQAPFIMKINSSMLPVAALAISADESYDDFERIYNDIIAPHFRRIDGVGTVFPIANPEKQLLIEVDPQRMNAYNISIQTIVMALQSEKITIPGGTIKIGDYDLPINIPGQINNQSDIEELIIVNYQNKVIRLKDIANVSIKHKSKDERVRSAGKQSIAMFVQKQTGANTLDTYKSILEEIENVQKVLPKDVQISEVFNTADIIDETINNLASTVWWGALWVMFVVLIFLRNYRSSLIIIVTIPFSLIFAFIIIYIFDYTINVFSLMSLVVAMGLVVDSAIVVLENIIQKIEKGEKPREASVFGSSEMQLAITASTMTTISVFLPMLFIGGIVGIMFKQLVVITISILLASLIAALTLTPMMTSLLIKKRERKHSKLYNWSENILVVIENTYKNILKWAIYHKTTVILIGIGIFGLSLFSVRFIGTDYIPNFDTGDMMIIIETDEGIGVNRTEEIATYIEEKVTEMVPYIEKSFIISGQTEKGLLSSVGFAEGKNAATIGFKMCLPDKRPKSTSEIAADLTSFLDSIPEVNKYNVSGGSILSAVVLGNVKPIEIKLFGNDFHKLDEAASLIIDALKKDPTFYNIEIPSSRNKPEINFIIDKQKAAAYNINSLSASMQVRQSIYGAEAGKININNEDMTILVKYDSSYVDEINKILDIQLTSMRGSQIRLGDIAQIETSASYQEISRESQQRVFRVSADIKNTSLGEAGEKTKKIIEELNIDPSIEVKQVGQISEQATSFDSLILAALIGLMLVYMIMAALFKSFKHPFIILFTVPFTITGVILGFLITGTTLSIVTFTGIIMLLGIVVNNGIVLIDYTNLLRKRGYSISEAVQEAGRSRLRPVLMTTLTTILAMVPMAISKTMGSEIWSPLGITMIGGLSVSTLITLIFVPVVYSSMEAKKVKQDKIKKQTS